MWKLNEIADLFLFSLSLLVYRLRQVVHRLTQDLIGIYHSLVLSLLTHMKLKSMLE